MNTLVRGGLLVALLVAAAVGCSRTEDTAESAPAISWAEFSAATIAEYYARNPESAVNAGLHEYDGQMRDMSIAANEDYVSWLMQKQEALQSYADLKGIEAFERDYLDAAFAGEVFDYKTSGFMRNNPIFYSGHIGTSVYTDREYAPLAERMAAYTAYIAQLPAFLDTMRTNLQPPLPASYVTVGHGILSGLAGYLRDTVPGIFAPVDDEQLQARFLDANDAAVIATQEAAAWLESLQESATDGYALGEQRFLEMLRAKEGVDISIAELKAAGERDLEANLLALQEACEEYAPELDVRACVLKVQNNKPAGGAVDGARRQLPALREFVEKNQLVTIPGTEDALVDEAPPHRRFNAAYINIPGPFETGLPSTYFIAPADPDWSEADQLAYVPGETVLLAISVHEVWPGHFLQFLHANRVDNNVGRHFGTYSFTEGWAHYTEQMMWDAGLGDGDPEVRIGQLLNALLRNVRYLSAIGLHAGGMTVDESRQMFLDAAFQDYGNAVQQSLRGTYDPGYLNYTLGKLMINKLRSDWVGDQGGREAWGKFHDEFLSYGSPPVPLIRQQMLGDDYEGDSALLP
ncbi:MAG: DUF885 domain-containing protein [Woeseiaceae bacterium]